MKILLPMALLLLTACSSLDRATIESMRDAYQRSQRLNERWFAGEPVPHSSAIDAYRAEAVSINNLYDSVIKNLEAR